MLRLYARLLASHPAGSAVASSRAGSSDSASPWNGNGAGSWVSSSWSRPRRRAARAAVPGADPASGRREAWSADGGAWPPARRPSSRSRPACTPRSACVRATPSSCSSARLALTRSAASHRASRAAVRAAGDDRRRRAAGEALAPLDLAAVGHRRSDRPPRRPGRGPTGVPLPRSWRWARAGIRLCPGERSHRARLRDRARAPRGRHRRPHRPRPAGGRLAARRARRVGRPAGRCSALACASTSHPSSTAPRRRPGRRELPAAELRATVVSSRQPLGGVYPSEHGRTRPGRSSSAAASAARASPTTWRSSAGRTSCCSSGRA